MRLKNKALVCLPADTVDKGLRLKELGKVDIEKAKRQHQVYREALESFGYSLITLPADNRYPDSVFVEDPAIIIGGVLIVTSLCKKERQGEEVAVEAALKPFFNKVFRIEPPGFVEGGDVLVANQRLFIGFSARTNLEGALQLAQIAKKHYGYSTRLVDVPKNRLHLKGQVSFHRLGKKNIIIADEEIADEFDHSGCEIIATPTEERFGANCISKNGRLLLHKGRLKTKKILSAREFDVKEIDLSEFEKIDGAMTCLSKLF